MYQVQWSKETTVHKFYYLYHLFFAAMTNSAQSGLNIDSEKERQLSRTLLLVTFTFLLLTTTQYVRHILFTFWDYKKVCLNCKIVID